MVNNSKLHTFERIGYRGLGLGDFFFAGILTVQTCKRFGLKTAIIAATVIAIVFGIWDAYLFDINKWLSSDCWKKHRRHAGYSIYYNWLGACSRLALWFNAGRKQTCPRQLRLLSPLKTQTSPFNKQYYFLFLKTDEVANKLVWGKIG